MEKLLISRIADDHALDAKTAVDIAADGRIDPAEEHTALVLLSMYPDYQLRLEEAELAHKLSRQVECLGVERAPDRTLRRVMQEVSALKHEKGSHAGLEQRSRR